MNASPNLDLMDATGPLSFEKRSIFSIGDVEVCQIDSKQNDTSHLSNFLIFATYRGMKI